jgi:hypothetical protein
VKITRLSLRLAAAVATMGLAACESLGPNSSLTNDAAINADVAHSSGDAIASVVEAMSANEVFAGLSNVTAGPPAAATSNSLTFDRTRTCYDASDAVVNNCSPLSSVRKVVTHVEIDGSRSGSHTTSGGGEATWLGVVHRVLDDTLTRNFNSAQPPVETSRTHTLIGTAHDTSTFTGDRIVRVVAETALDSIRAVTWNLPRSTNPFPVSGSIVRNVEIKVTAASETRTESREVSRRIQVNFPADAQGNVTLMINDRTCTLNLVTHVVRDCQ